MFCSKSTVWCKESVLGRLPIVVLGTRGMVEAADVLRLAVAVLLRGPETFVTIQRRKRSDTFFLVDIEVAATVPVPFP